MPLAETRALLNAALDGGLASQPMRRDPLFGFAVPIEVPGVPPEILNPRMTWSDAAAYDRTAARLVGMFSANFEKFAGHVDSDVLAAGPVTSQTAAAE